VPGTAVKELITEAIVDNLLSWRHSGFSAHGAVRVDDRQSAVRLGHYMIRCPIVLKRLSWEVGSSRLRPNDRPITTIKRISGAT